MASREKALLGTKSFELFTPNLELYNDAIDRSIIITAAKLIFWRKYPIVGRVRFLSVFCSAWFEISAFISYERGEFFTEFVPKVRRELETLV